MCVGYKKCPYYCLSKQHHKYLFAAIINNRNRKKTIEEEIKVPSAKVNWEVYNNICKK